MATATASVGSLAQEVASLEAEIASLTAKRESERENLQALFDSRTALQADIARGKEPPSKVAALTVKIQGTESMLAGVEQLLAQAQRHLDRVAPELRRRRDEEKLRAEMEAIDALGAEAKAIVERIARALNTVASGDLAKFEQTRNQLLSLNKNFALLGQFPIPATTQRAQQVLGELDRTIKEKLTPILKLFR